MLTLCLAGGSPAGAQTDDERLEASTLKITPREGTRIVWDGRPFGGAFTVSAHSDGAAVVEEVDPELYLQGIREVPSTWNPEALAAQVVAARTYLAWTLQGGRAGSAARYGFDICATDACQVYRGLADPGSAAAWFEAVAVTADEVLLYDGRPAQALYSSTSGGRTRAVQDVFVGSGPLPYLQAVASPDEDSPFVEWEYVLDSDDLESILRQAGLRGRLYNVHVIETEDGTGPWQIVASSSEERRSFDSWEFRSLMNRWGPRLLPAQLPAVRADTGRRYPQVVLSPTFDVVREVSGIDFGSYSDSPYEFRYRIIGHGWGHLVGMSQYGALAMAEAGSTYDQILAHFYGGLLPTAAGEVLPDSFLVGLDWGEDTVIIETDGLSDVRIDGESVGVVAAGVWTVEWRNGRLVIEPPVAYGVPAGLSSSATAIPDGSGLVVVRGFLPGPGEVRLVVFRGDRPVYKTAWVPFGAGPGALTWERTLLGSDAVFGLSIVAETRGSDGSVWNDLLALR
ncbi:MAG: SpoIID/LytB domain-containing protein [Acidimicrobiia bacterium]|nr:SpoIID/LytB domain-containing protein [Acidimicrobiia bacterium]